MLSMFTPPFEKTESIHPSRFHIKDLDSRRVTGDLSSQQADEIVEALNAAAEIAKLKEALQASTVHFHQLAHGGTRTSIWECREAVCVHNRDLLAKLEN